MDHVSNICGFVICRTSHQLLPDLRPLFSYITQIALAPRHNKETLTLVQSKPLTAEPQLIQYE